MTNDADKLQGTWLAVAGERNGGQPLSAEEAAGVKVTFDRDHLRLCMGEPEDRPAEFKTRAGSRLINLDLVQQTAVGPIAFEAVTGQLVQTGTLVIDRLGKLS